MSVTDGNGNYSLPTIEEERFEAVRAEHELASIKDAAYDCLLYEYEEYLNTLTIEEQYDLYIEGKLMQGESNLKDVTTRANDLTRQFVNKLAKGIL